MLTCVRLYYVAWMTLMYSAWTWLLAHSYISDCVHNNINLIIHLSQGPKSRIWGLDPIFAAIQEKDDFGSKKTVRRPSQEGLYALSTGSITLKNWFTNRKWRVLLKWATKRITKEKWKESYCEVEFWGSQAGERWGNNRYLNVYIIHLHILSYLFVLKR